MQWAVVFRYLLEHLQNSNTNFFLKSKKKAHSITAHTWKMTSIPAVWEIELVSQTSLMHKLSIHLDGQDEGVETLQWKTATSPASTIHGNSNCFLQKPTHQIPSLHILTVWTAVHTNGLLQPTRWAMAYRQKKTQIQRSGQDDLYNQGRCFLGLRMEGGFSKSFMWVGGGGGIVQSVVFRLPGKES